MLLPSFRSGTTSSGSTTTHTSWGPGGAAVHVTETVAVPPAASGGSGRSAPICGPGGVPSKKRTTVSTEPASPALWMVALTRTVVSFATGGAGVKPMSAGVTARSGLGGGETMIARHARLFVSFPSATILSGSTTTQTSYVPGGGAVHVTDTFAVPPMERGGRGWSAPIWGDGGVPLWNRDVVGADTFHPML